MELSVRNEKLMFFFFVFNILRSELKNRRKKDKNITYVKFHKYKNKQYGETDVLNHSVTLLELFIIHYYNNT